MTIMMWIHIAGGSLALLAGVLAVTVRKGSRLHAQAGNWFAAAMLVLGVSATFLATQEGSALGAGGILTCYFVATSWSAARRRDGTSGALEILLCAVVTAGAAALMWNAANGGTTPAGPAPLYLFSAVCLLAGLLDLNVILRPKLTAAQRISRHLWRMCVAFFIATGSFFIGQQDVMPEAIRGSPILFAMGFAPLVLMVFWLIRLRFAKHIRQLSRRIAGPEPQVTVAEAGQ